MIAREPIYLTPEEVADLLRTTRKAIYSRIDRGRLPGVRRVGGRLLVNRAELLAWVESCAPSSRRT